MCYLAREDIIPRPVPIVLPRIESGRQRYGAFNYTSFDKRGLSDNITYILGDYLNLTHRQIAKGNIIDQDASCLEDS
jgi:hypothetical protein